MGDWFARAFGFVEKSFYETQDMFEVLDGPGGTSLLRSFGNGKTFELGRFELPSLGELTEKLRSSREESAAFTSSSLDVRRAAGDDVDAARAVISDVPDVDGSAVAPALEVDDSDVGGVAAGTPGSGSVEVSSLGVPSSASLGRLSFKNISDDVRSLHSSPLCNGAVFQVASQFNVLEMVGPSVQPEDGPACAMSCPAATVFRNYFCQGGRGQAGGSDKQVNTLRDVGAVVGNDTHKYWTMRNGYALPVDDDSIGRLSARLEADPVLTRSCQLSLRVGVHWETQVGSKDSSQRVTQVFCSAVPVSYSRTMIPAWKPFAAMILAAAFESTIAVGALLARQRKSRVSVYLTCLGGGAFGNLSVWIADGLKAALEAHAGEPVDVFLVHYRSGAPAVFARVEQELRAAQKSGK